MSVFGTNQVGEIIVGKAYAAQANMVDFINNAVNGDVQVLSGDSSAVAANKPFKVLQKADNAAGGIEYTEVIDPKNINFIKATKYVAPVSRSLKVTGFTGTIRPNATYEVFIRLLNDGGTLSPENFRFIPAFYVTPVDVTGLTFAMILAELKSNLEKALVREGNTSFTITTTATELVITGGNTPFSLGKKDGRPVEFYLQATVRSNGDCVNCNQNSGNYFSDLAVETITPGSPGSGSGYQVANLEWCHKGEKYSKYRSIAYPVNFDTPYNVDPTLNYDIVTIGYYKERSYTNVEKQHRTLIIALDNTDATLITSVVADLNTATGLTTVVV